eukprot:1143185-Pelagomonas_calceolata.AAC.2
MDFRQGLLQGSRYQPRKHTVLQYRTETLLAKHVCFKRSTFNFLKKRRTTYGDEKTPYIN